MTTDYDLAEVLSEFARTMVTDFPIQAILDRLVDRIVDIMPVTAAGVTLISPETQPRYIAASDDDALRFEQLQTDLNEGPCLASYRSGQVIEIPNLRHEDRFTRFVPAALDAGLEAVFTFPLHHGGVQLGALDLYRSAPGELDREARIAAQILADVAAAYLINAQARADLQDASDRSRYDSLHDSLTGLPNRALILERLEHAFLRGRRSQITPAVFFVDLDHFKAVNDTYGHRIGDELLIAAGRRLSGLLRPGDTLARLAGDEFVILCEDAGTPAQAAAIASRLNAALARPYVLSNAEVHVTASVGIAYADRASVDPEQILHDADLSMYQAKRRTKGSRHVLDLRDGHLAERHAGLERDLDEAMGRGELHLDYQPIVGTVDRLIVGAEALLRWTNPARGIVSPTVLIPIAERSGVMTGIGQWVLEQAWADRRRWKPQRGGDDFAVNVNVSHHQIMAESFVDAVAAALETGNADPSTMTLEIPQSIFLRDGERASVVLNDLKALGVTLALQDYATGSFSLSYLFRFPLDIVKIDRGFVKHLGSDSAARTIVTAIIDLSHHRGMTVIAEGVETAEHHRELTALGCDFSQGYYFARPMPAATFDTVLQTHSDRGHAVCRADHILLR